MKALILAAGFGNRMKPLTNDTHKTLLKIGDETIIERIINGLIENNITQIVIVTGYKKEQLTNFLLTKYPKIEFQFIDNPNYRTTNNIFSLSLAFEKIDFDDDIILIESDLIYDVDVIKRIVNTPYKNAALLDKYKSGMDGTVVKVVDNKITSVIPTHLQGKNFDFSNKYKTLNIYKFSKEFCKNEFKKMLTYYAKTFDTNCYYELILGILIYMQREEIYAEILEEEKWAEVDDPNDLRVAEFVFCPQKRLEILKSSFGGYWNYKVLDYCFIRNMYFPNASMISEIKKNISNLLHNYGSKQIFLNEKLSYFLGYQKDNIQLLNGAAEIYPILGQYFKNKQVLIPAPTFGEYTRVFQNISEYSDNIGFNTEEIFKKSKYNDVVVFVNPNNPTGSEISTDYIYNFAKENANKFIIVDESFIEFSRYNSIILKLEEHPVENIIVIKSLSKTLGVPGVRLGYVYTQSKELMSYISENIPIWNTNSIAEFLLEIMLKHKNSLNYSYIQTIEDREEFIKKLKTVNFIDEVFDSGSNFILVRTKINSENLVKYMLEKHCIYLKDVSEKFNDGNNYLRFAVRLPKENNLLVEKLKNYQNQ